MDVTVKRRGGFKGKITVPGDKSISHRAVMFASLADGTSEIEGFLEGADCLSTIACFSRLGVKITRSGEFVKVEGAGLRGLKRPNSVLDAGNSGTTIRLMSGIMAGQSFGCELDGDDSIRSRPMLRVIEPLRAMGANISGTNGDFAPLKISGGKLRGIDYEMPVASAQVKSAIILASLYADSETIVREKAKSRDHTEIMLKGMGARIAVNGGNVAVSPCERLNASKIKVPGDISSAAFFVVAATISEGSELLIENVGLNPTRSGIIEVLLKMGANIEILNEREVCGEKVGDLFVKSANLRGGITVDGAIIPSLIDDIPILAVAAAFADGETIIKDAKELRVKESDRLSATAEEMTKIGADVTELPDGLVINGGKPLKGAAINSRKDHRTAMSLGIAGLNADGETTISGAEYVNISFPNFFEKIL